MNDTYEQILKVWNNQTPDDFAIFSELYYEMFGGRKRFPTQHLPPVLLFSLTFDDLF